MVDERNSRRVPVEFESEGAILRGFLFRATRGPSPHPVVVMTHGTSATLTMVTDRYAEVFAEAGVSVLLYDHRNFGISGGEPRQEINPWIQARGYRNAIDFASRIDDHDPQRIAIWGDSYSAGIVFVVAAVDRRVRAVVAQCPVFGDRVPTTEPSPELFEAIAATLENGDVSGTPEDVTGPIPVVSADQMGTPSLLKPIQAFRWFIEQGGRHGSGWENRATRVVPSNTPSFSPFMCAPFVEAPALMMVAPDDEMTHANPEVSLAAFTRLSSAKDWYDIDGGHFGLLYHPSDLFDEASAVQAEFLSRVLLPESG